MALRLCVECGGRRAGPATPCPDCGAPPSAWRAERVGLFDLGRRLGAFFGGAITGGACLLAAAALLSGWAGDSWWFRALQVVVTAVVVVFGAPVGVILMVLGARALVERRWSLRAAPLREGTALTAMGVLIEAEGRSVRRGPPLAFPRADLDALESYAALATPPPEVVALLGATPGRAEVAVACALAGLAARGRLTLTVVRQRAWRVGGDGLGPKSLRVVLDQRRFVAARGPAASDVESGWLEASLLSALVSPSARDAVGDRGPYRAAAREVDAPAPVGVADLLVAFTGGRRKARRWLRKELTRRLDEVSPRPPDAVARAVVEGVAAGDPASRVALFAEVALGLTLRAPLNDARVVAAAEASPPEPAA